MISCIYTITNKVNGKLYVGKTNNFLYRMSKHKYTLRNNIHINALILKFLKNVMKSIYTLKNIIGVIY